MEGKRRGRIKGWEKWEVEGNEGGNGEELRAEEKSERGGRVGGEG